MTPARWPCALALVLALSGVAGPAEGVRTRHPQQDNALAAKAVDAIEHELLEKMHAKLSAEAPDGGGGADGGAADPHDLMAQYQQLVKAIDNKHPSQEDLKALIGQQTPQEARVIAQQLQSDAKFKGDATVEPADTPSVSVPVSGAASGTTKGTGEVAHLLQLLKGGQHVGPHQIQAALDADDRAWQHPADESRYLPLACVPVACGTPAPAPARVRL